MNAADTNESLSLIGGPTHRLGLRLGLVRGGVNPFPLGLALAALLWGVLVVLSLIEGCADRVFSLTTIAGHVRLLVTIPLLFLCETWLEPRLGLFVRQLVRSEVVPPGELPALRAVLARVERGRDSWLPEAACLAAAVAVAATAVLSGASPLLEVAGTSVRPSGVAASAMPLTGWWYWLACLTVIRFLVFRWLWRLLLGWRFLWRLSRLKLRLIPAHPDRVGGLGYLEAVQSAFVPLVVAISATQAASLAESLAAGTMPFEAVYPAATVLLVVQVLLFVAPVAVFSPKLWACQARGLADFGLLGASYATQFERKWIDSPETAGEPLLGSADIQSLADVASGVAIVQEMRLVPVSRRLLLTIGAAAALPLLPLTWFQFPAGELTRRLLASLVGA